MTKVNCTIEGCQYWGQGNVCHANEILVNTNAADDAIFNDDTEFAAELEPGVAGDYMNGFASAQTKCETMRPRDDFNYAGSFFPGSPDIEPR